MYLTEYRKKLILLAMKYQKDFIMKIHATFSKRIYGLFLCLIATRIYCLISK